MAGRKDVGILAMDIYFPPTCVQQVKFFSPRAPAARVTVFRRYGRVESMRWCLRSAVPMPSRIAVWGVL